MAESTVRRFVRKRKRELGLTGGGETFIPQSYRWGQEAQVDWYEAWAEMGGERQKLYVFCMRSMASGGAFHRVYPHASQQAFLEAHELAFRYFGGVFAVLRFDNLKSAVQKILRGHQREETQRFIAFRSHCGFQSEFCTPGRGNEKGGVEEEGGHFRRNYLVPLPVAHDLEHLNETAAGIVPRGGRPDDRRARADDRGGDGDRARVSAAAAGGGLRPGGGLVSEGERKRLRAGTDELLLGAGAARDPGRGESACCLCRDLARGSVRGAP